MKTIVKTKRFIHGGDVLLDEAQKALKKNDMERCRHMIKDAIEMLSNGLRELSNGKEENQKEKSKEKTA